MSLRSTCSSLAFLAANLPKAASGGWLPLGIGSVVFVVMATWWVGQRRIQLGRRRGEMPLSELQNLLTGTKGVPYRVPGDGVFIARNPTIVPIALISMVTQNSALHKRAILLSYSTVDVPTTVGSKHRISVQSLPSRIVPLTNSHSLTSPHPARRSSSRHRSRAITGRAKCSAGHRCCSSPSTDWRQIRWTLSSCPQTEPLYSDGR
jgi:K+ transporter